ncbi:MAG: hypothetical protein Q9157_005669 [Trypethelium eluteriae]
MDLPALPPPPGVVPDLANPPSGRRDAVLVSSIILLVFPTVLVSIRSYVRFFILKKWLVVDYVCILAWCLLVVLISLGFSTLKDGNGRHGWDLTAAHFSKYAEVLNDQQIIYVVALLVTKTAILLQLMEIFVPQARTSRWWLMVGMIALNTIYLTINLFLEIFVCIPREKIWNPSTPGHCIDIGVLFIASAAVNLGEDLLILALPISWILRLQVNSRRKVGISVVYATGIFACVSSAMRLVESIKTDSATDISYALVPVYLWAVAEVASGLIVCCLPFIPRFFRRSPPQTSTAGTRKVTDHQKSFASGRRNYHELDEISLQRSAAALGQTETKASRDASASWTDQLDTGVAPRHFLDKEELEKGIPIQERSAPSRSAPPPRPEHTV